MSEKKSESDFIGNIDHKYVGKEALKTLIISILICLGIFCFVWIPLSTENAPNWAFTILYVALAGIFLVINIFVYIYNVIYWKSFTYMISEQYIRIHSGVFTKSKTTIPFSRIQNINLTQGVFDRMFGLHTVKIETAGKSAGQQQGGPIRPEGYIPGIKDPSNIVQIIDKLIHKYTQNVPENVKSNVFLDSNLVFDEFIAYFLSKMREKDQIKTKIQKLREKAGLTVGELAEKLDITYQTIKYLEAGEYVPSLTLAMTIARYFGVKIEEIFELN
jgi:membrane protein YdbS with pleckstrin-like domain/DNA-binding XRE family transcriptional regulator